MQLVRLKSPNNFPDHGCKLHMIFAMTEQARHNLIHKCIMPELAVSLNEIDGSPISPAVL